MSHWETVSRFNAAEMVLARARHPQFRPVVMTIRSIERIWLFFHCGVKSRLWRGYRSAVLLGGHDVPEEVVSAAFCRRLKKLFCDLPTGYGLVADVRQFRSERTDPD